MKLRLHHVNVVSDNMDELHDFYALLGLDIDPLPPMIEHLGHQNKRSDDGEEDKWNRDVTFFDARGGEDVDLQILATRRQAFLAARMGAIPSNRSSPDTSRSAPTNAVRKQPDRQRKFVFRLGRVGREELGPDLLQRSRRQHHRGSSGARMIVARHVSAADPVVGGSL